MEKRKKTPPEQINKKLRRARLKKLWTLQAAADIVKVSFTTFLRWEMGKQQPSLVSLEKLCQTFEKTAEELGYGHLTVLDDDPSPTPLSASSPTNHLADEGITPISAHAVDDIEQKHQQLTTIAKGLFPKAYPIRVNKFQDNQHTIHVFCDAQIDKSTITSIKAEFRNRTGWVIGIQKTL